MTVSMPAQFDQNFEGLMSLVGLLRGPDGCPWDREQTRESFRDQFLEEAYELIEALDEGDPEAITEEVGDVLLHAAFQIQLGKETNAFNDEDVIGGLINKLIRRHPHVFAKANGDLNASDVLANWDDIKRAEKTKSEKMSTIDGVPTAMPSLSRAQDIQNKAARVGFDWNDILGVLDKVQEEINELKTARNSEAAEAEIGDLIFSIVNVARWIKVDAETALRKSNNRFSSRFKTMELIASQRGAEFGALPMEEKESLWAEAKRSS